MGWVAVRGQSRPLSYPFRTRSPEAKHGENLILGLDPSCPLTVLTASASIQIRASAHYFSQADSFDPTPDNPMKNTIRIFAAAALIAAASTPAFAQGGGGGGGGGGGMSMQERQAAQRALMFEGITLTDAQKTKIDSISAASQKARADLRASMGEQPDRQAMQAKNMEIVTKEREAIKGVLTKEQATTFDANIAKMPQGRGRGGR